MKTIFSLLFLFYTISSFSQGALKDSTKTDYKNIIAIDINPLLNQFFNFNQNSNYYYSPYILSYRRIIKNSAIKLAVGGDIYSNNEKRQDSLDFSSERTTLNLALGFEHYAYLSKRWTAYVGADFINSYTKSNGKYSWSTTNYSNDEDKSTSYGIAPVLGIVFKITKRMSISTQTSYNIAYVNSIQTRKQIPNDQYDTKTVRSGITTNFIAPTSVTFRLKF